MHPTAPVLSDELREFRPRNLRGGVLSVGRAARSGWQRADALERASGAGVATWGLG
jgi:hypothetical protein